MKKFLSILMVCCCGWASAQNFPYHVTVTTVAGHCYDDAHIIFTLSDHNGNEIQIDPLTHNAVDITQYPLYNVQYHYQNVSSGLGVQYDYDNDIMLTVGTYCVGVRANIPAQDGGYVLVDTTFCDVQVTSLYQHMEASALFNLASNKDWSNREKYGYRPSFSCKDMGRIQLQITQGAFPYEVIILNEQQDTVRHTVFYDRINSGTSYLYADYRDYYTFDSLAIGTYSITVSDSCGYAVPISFTIPDADPDDYTVLVNVKNYSCPDDNVVPFLLEIGHAPQNSTLIWYEYTHVYFDSILQYRFINPGNDTTEWRTLNVTSSYDSWNSIGDTMPSYCSIFNDTVKAEVRDLCKDTVFTYTFKFLPQFDFFDRFEEVQSSDSLIHDTCTIHLVSGINTQSYRIEGEKGAIFSQTGSTLPCWTNSFREVPFRFYKCPLTYNIWSMPDSILLGQSQSDEYSGLGTWVTFYVDTILPVHISVTDSAGCEVSAKDTVLVYQAEPVDDLLFWFECHNDLDDDENNHCCEDRYLWIQEHGVDANTFRRNMTLRLMDSPLNDRFNFTAIRQDGVWTVTPDNPDNHTTYVEFTYGDGWRATVRDSVCLAPGRYTFEVSTDCGVDTITYQWIGYYCDSVRFTSAPQYEIEQVCDHIVVTQVSSGLENYLYTIDPSVSNDDPIRENCWHTCYSCTLSGISAIKDDQNRNVFVFSVPGTYIIETSSYNTLFSEIYDYFVSAWCTETQYHYDTITIALSYLDFDMAAAILCDSLSTTGIITAHAINGNAPYTYTIYDQWNAAGNIIASNSSGFFEGVSMTEGQQFSVMVTDSCSTSFSINITAALLTHGNLLWEKGSHAGIPHCVGDTVHLAALAFPPPVSYQWSVPNGLSVTSQTNEIVLSNNVESGWYKVEILNSFCSSSMPDSVYITVRNLLPKTDTIYLCENDSLTITAQHTPPFLWNTGDTTQSITVSSEGDYTVSLSDAYGCYYDSTVHVILIPSIPVTSLFVTVLENELPYTINDSSYQAEGSYTQTLTSAMGCDSVLTIELTVLYNINDQLDSTICENELPFLWNDSLFTEMGTKTTVIPASNGVDSIISMNLYTRPLPSAQISGTSLLCTDSSGTVSADSAVTYLWSSGDTTQSIMVNASGLYSVTVTDEYGCINSATHKIINLIVNPIETIQIPALCAGGSETILVGSNQGSHILIGQYDSIPFLSDEIIQSDNIFTASTEVASVEVDNPWAVNVGDTSFVISIPEDLPHDTTITCVIHLHNAFGCSYDTTITVIGYSHSQFEFDTTVCDSFTWNGVDYTASGQYTQTLVNEKGCDSVVTMNLTVFYSSVLNDTLVLVQNQLPYYFAPTDTTFGMNSASAFSFSYWRTGNQGCDTLCNQTVIVYQNTQHTEDTTVCASEMPFTWHGHIFTEAGSYTDTLLSANGSDSVCIYMLSVDLVTAAINSPTHIVCYGASTGAASATVTGGAVPLDYVWTNALGTTVSTTVQISNQPADFYTFIVTDQLGCSAADTVTLLALSGELTPGSITDNQEVCEGDMLMDFSGTVASGGDNSIYQWQVSTDNADWDAAPGTNNGQNYSYPLPVSNSFALRRAWISQSCGTEYSNTVTVTVGFNTIDTIIAQVCQNTPYMEFGFDISADETVEPGTYTFEKHYPAGICDSIIVLMLTVNATSFTELMMESCGSFSWNGITYYEPGNYEQTLENATGCDSLVQLQLSLIDTGVEIVPLTEDFCEEMSAELSVITELADYVWNTGEEMPTITVTVPGTYSVTASQGDCRNSASYTINPCELHVSLPNAITPSRNDGHNDGFAIPTETQAIMHTFEIRIFNRWGEQIFYSTDKNFQWKGESKGKIFYNTVYTYIIRYTDANGKPYYVTGSVTVL